MSIRTGVAVVLVGMLGLFAAAPAGGVPPTHTLSLTATGANGVNSIMSPALSCADGGQGNYRNELIEAPLPAGILGQVAGDVRGNLNVNHDGVEPPVGAVTNNAFLLGNTSRVSLSNQRGAMQLQLSAGTCAKPTLAFDGTTVGPGSGTWTIDPASPGNNGAYRQAGGSGTFSLTARVGPGAANPWSISLTGTATILEPSLSISVVKTYWGNLGLDYALRNVSVTYAITNSGPGDAFGVTLDSTSSSTKGVTPLGPTPQAVGDIASQQSAQATVVYHLGLFDPCTDVILNCNFASTLNVTMPDALDSPVTSSASAPVSAPALPPPL
jgi:hypothetical protein